MIRVSGSWVKRASDAARLDARNILAYGRSAPRYAERVWIDPAVCNRLLVNRFSSSLSGRVLFGDWDLETAPLSNSTTFNACVLHWQEGVPWEETGVFEYMMDLIASQGYMDGCRSLEDVKERYSRLDAMYRQILSEKRLKSTLELYGQKRRRALGEVLVHVDRNGGLIFGRQGTHRLAASLSAGLPCIPSQIGAVHADALPRWNANAYRSVHRPKHVMSC